MSSRTVLTTIANLPDTSAFRMAQDWPLVGHLLAAAVNEIKAMRGDLWALIGNERLPFKPLLPPSAVREQETKRAQVRAAHDETLAQLRGG